MKQKIDSPSIPSGFFPPNRDKMSADKHEKNLVKAMTEYKKREAKAKEGLKAVKEALGKKCKDFHPLCLECQSHMAVEFLEEFFI